MIEEQDSNRHNTQAEMVERSYSSRRLNIRRNLFPSDANITTSVEEGNCTDDESSAETVVVLREGEGDNGPSTNNHSPTNMAFTHFATGLSSSAHRNPMNIPEFQNLRAISAPMGPSFWSNSLVGVTRELNEIDEEERLMVIRERLEESYGKSCRKFFLLCLIPTIFTSIVVWSLLIDLGDCESDELTTCKRERRVFINAYTAKCICQAILAGT